MASAHALAAFPNGTEAPAAKRRGVRPIRVAQRDLGVSKGGRSAPHFGPGIRKGVKLPCACLLLTFLQEQKSKGPARPERVEGKKKKL